MLSKVSIHNSNGGCYETEVKWLPAEVVHMNIDQLRGMLTEMRVFAKFFSENYSLLCSRKNALRSLYEKYRKSRNNFIGFAIALLISIGAMVAATMHYMYKGDWLSGEFVLLSVIAAVILIPFVLVDFIILIKNFYNYKKKSPKLSDAITSHENYFNQALMTTYFCDYNSGLVILPDYFLDYTAIDFMYTAVCNQRAVTLAQAVNLYEQDKFNHMQLALQQAQAQYAMEAAQYAESIAVSSAFTAMNTASIAVNTLFR